MRNAYKILIGKPEGKRTLVRDRRRWENNTGIGLREIGWGRGCGLASSGSEQRPVASYSEHSNGHLGSIKDSAPWS
jgi:hypothetical protein